MRPLRVQSHQWKLRSTTTNAEGTAEGTNCKVEGMAIETILVYGLFVTPIGRFALETGWRLVRDWFETAWVLSTRVAGITW